MSIAFSIAPVAQVYSILCYICYFLSVLVYSFFHFFKLWNMTTNWSSTSLVHRIDITRGFITSMLYLGEVRCVCVTLSYIYLYFLSLLMFKEIQLSGLWAHVLYASWKFQIVFCLTVQWCFGSLIVVSWSSKTSHTQMKRWFLLLLSSFILCKI